MGKKQDTKQNSRTRARAAGRRDRADVPAMLSVKKIPRARGAQLGAAARRVVPARGAVAERAAAAADAVDRRPGRRAAADARRSTQPSEDAPAQQLQRSDFVVRQLQGNLLHTLIAPALPELAGKVTGMLLEGLNVERSARC